MPSFLFSWCIQTMVAFLATIAFSIIFHAPKKQWLFTGITGAAGWLCYLVCTHFHTGVTAASFFAAVVLTLISRFFSFHRKEPVTVFLICGIFPIVPGAGIYYTGYHFFMSQNALALNKGLETMKIAVAIALGVGIVLSLPRFFFTLKLSKGESRRENSSHLGK